MDPMATSYARRKNSRAQREPGMEDDRVRRCGDAELLVGSSHAVWLAGHTRHNARCAYGVPTQKPEGEAGDANQPLGQREKSADTQIV